MYPLRSFSRSAAVGLLALAALTTVSAAPKGRFPARRTTPRVVKDPRMVAPPLESVKALRAHIASLKQWGRAHGTKPKTGYLEAYLFRLQHLAFPNDRVDWNAHVRALSQRDRLPPANLGVSRRPGFQSAAALSRRWEYVGPNNLSVPYRIYYGQGSLSGRVNDVAYGPAADPTYWVATASGGVWKSTNSGQTWSFLSHSWPAQETSCIALHPTDGNTAYVGTGDFQGFGGYYGFGVMKTSDGGLTWTNLGNAQFGNNTVSDIVVDPENPQIVLATTGRGRAGLGQVWRSTNGGQTWTAVVTTPKNWCGLSFGARSSNGSRQLWAVGNGGDSEVWRSGDRGATWTKLNVSLASGYYEGLGIAASRISPNAAYLLSGSDRKVFKTVDAGTTWKDVTAGFPNDGSPGDFYNWSQSWYDWHITTSTNGNQDVIYVGLIDLAVSADGGTTWQSVGSTYGQNALTHNDQHCLAVNPSKPNEVLVGNDGGIYRMTYDPANSTVVFNTTLNSGLGITQFYKADYHPTDPSRMLGGTQDNATPVATGDLAQWRNVCGGDGCGCIINPLTPEVQFASAQNQLICRTGDQWFADILDISPQWGTDRLPFIGRLVLAPSDPSLLYAGSNYLWRWNDTERNWTPRLGGTDLAPSGGTLLSIAVAPSNGNVIYTGASSGELFMTTDGGASWMQLNAQPSTLPERSILAISVHSTNPYEILVGLSGTGSSHLWRCINTNQANRIWSNASGAGAFLPDSPVNAIARDPNQPSSHLYVAMDTGVFVTINSGAGWQNATAPLGLPNVIVNDLKFVPGTGYLMAATYGRGIWRIDAQASLLSLTSPNGGEAWLPGTTQTLAWSSTNLTDPVKLEYSTDAGSSWLTIAANTANDGSEPWVVPNTPSTTTRVRVSSVADPTVNDVSDANFTIIRPSLTLSSPNGGESWLVGSTHSITWTSANVAGSVKLEYSTDAGAHWSLLAANTSNDGAETWIVPNKPSSQARVRISSVSDGNIRDESDADFTIPLPTLTLLSPNGAEQWNGGSMQTITWSSTNLIGNVKLEYTLDHGASWIVLAADTPNDGSAPWEPPADGRSTGRVRITSLSIPQLSDESDAEFAILASLLTVTSPRGGEVWDAGSAHTLTWQSSGSTGNVKLEYSPDGGRTWTTLVANTTNDGAEPWTTPSVPTSEARIRVSAVDGSVSGMSGTFSLRYSGGTLKAPTKVSFGIVRVGKSKSVQVQLTNTSKTQRLVLSTAVQGPGFRIAGSTGPFTLAPKKSVKVPVSCTPSATGSLSGTLQITCSDPTRPTVTVPLTAKATR